MMVVSFDAEVVFERVGRRRNSEVGSDVEMGVGLVVEFDLGGDEACWRDGEGGKNGVVEGSEGVGVVLDGIVVGRWDEG